MITPISVTDGFGQHFVICCSLQYTGPRRLNRLSRFHSESFISDLKVPRGFWKELLNKFSPNSSAINRSCMMREVALLVGSGSIYITPLPEKSYDSLSTHLRTFKHRKNQQNYNYVFSRFPARQRGERYRPEYFNDTQAAKTFIQTLQLPDEQLIELSHILALEPMIIGQSHPGRTAQHPE